MVAIKLGCLLVSLLVITTTFGAPILDNKETLCGYVYDWGSEDVGQQYSTNYISASWAGFESTEDTNNIVSSSVRYDWAIISDDLATETIRTSGTEEDPSIRCRSEVGISEKPDVADWVAVDSTYANNYQLSLTPGQTYYVLLRVTTTTIDETGKTTDSVIYTNGGGITISTETKYTRNNNARRGRNNGRRGVTTTGQGILRPPTVFEPPLLESSSPVIFVNSSHLSSFISFFSSGLFGWQIALIILACVFALILLLVLIFIVVGRSKGEDKYETNVHRNENVEKI